MKLSVDLEAVEKEEKGDEMGGGEDETMRGRKTNGEGEEWRREEE